jgi:hypothetical protein
MHIKPFKSGCAALGGPGTLKGNSESVRAKLIRCEYRFENFNARGDDEYLDRFSRRFERLFRAGWTAPEINRDPAVRGWWRLCLVKESDSRPESAPSRS